MSKITIFGDCHNNKGLNIILNKFDNLISLGDIAAVNTKEYLKRKEVYSRCWKSKSGKDVKVTKEEILWFDKLNIKGWNKQIEILDTYKKRLIVNMGNSDQRMLSWYKLKKSKYLKIINKIELISINKIQILFLPYDTKEIPKEILLKLKKNIFILTHVPPMEEHYLEAYNQIKQLNDLGIKMINLHGHIHADSTYLYNLKEFSNFSFITLKAEDTEEGMGFNHEIMEIDSKTGKFEFYNLKRNKIKPKNPPKKYLNNKDHWNNFIFQ